MLTSIVTFAELSNEVKADIENLRMKHYEIGTFIYANEDTKYYRPQEYKWTSIYFEDGILYIETQDGKWFIEMKRKED